jgi:hypothetical protein
MAEDEARRITREQRIAENELLFRSVNERIEELTESWSQAAMSAICECGDKDCFAPIDLPADEYRSLLGSERSGRRFIVLPGHEIPDVETVVERHEDYLIVEKPAEAVEIARDRD